MVTEVTSPTHAIQHRDGFNVIRAWEHYKALCRMDPPHARRRQFAATEIHSIDKDGKEAARLQNIEATAPTANLARVLRIHN